MNSLNKVQLIGNLTADPEIRQTPGGQFVASFSIATNRDWKDANGNKQSSSEFHSIVVWGKLAEIVDQYVMKGQKVYVEGRLQTRSWEDQSGQKRYKTEIITENLIMLGSHSSNESRGDDYDEEEYATRPANKPKTAATAGKPAAKKPSARDKQEEINIEDIPF